MTLLYHGTNGQWIQNIIKNGLEPRGGSKTRNNWKHVPHQSNSKCVYLTDSYAPFFAFNASRGNSPVCAVVEIDTDLLNEDNLYPDEDFLEQASRNIDDPVPGTMSERTLFYRSKQFEYSIDKVCQDPKTRDWITWWQASLKYLGTCAHRGVILPSAITRIVVWPHGENIQLMFVWDPTISLVNQQILGDRYRVLMRKLFDGEFTDPLEATEATAMARFTDPIIPPITGYKIIDFRKGG